MTRSDLVAVVKEATVSPQGSYGSMWIEFVREYCELSDGYRPWYDEDEGKEAPQEMVDKWLEKIKEP